MQAQLRPNRCTCFAKVSQKNLTLLIWWHAPQSASTLRYGPQSASTLQRYEMPWPFFICVSHKDVQAAEMCVMQCGLCPSPVPVCNSVVPLDFNAYLWHQPLIHPSPEMFRINMCLLTS